MTLSAIPVEPIHRSHARRAEEEPAERRAAGKKLRESVPRKAHASWQAPVGRRDPVDLLVETSAGRVKELLPIRYGRMMSSPFAFYRGGAALMAADLGGTPSTGIRVQACGDCHLVNFGGFATPERRIVFDINDFDETLPAPWEWDLKRLVTSVVIASQHNGFDAADVREAALMTARSYRRHMLAFSELKTLDQWYLSIDAEDLIDSIPSNKRREGIAKRIERAEEKGLHADPIPKLTEVLNGERVIKDSPPLIFHPQEMQRPEFEQFFLDSFESYRNTLRPDRRELIDRFHVQDYAIKVVGVGSVGTRCGIVLMMAADDDPLFLQIKEACASVLAPYAGRSLFDNHGERVVQGQRLMQAASDLFLGWSVGPKGHHFYVRQLRDVKIKPLVDAFNPTRMKYYGGACGWALARAHTKSGDAASIAGYLGKSERIDEAMVDFGVAYARQNEADHQELLRAIREGKIEARPD
ncbi:hypothetical protein AKJ09_02706 [Labilithrix luteola]|uniref:DUF2252 domain-containing protein n=1 Tax=Labilithrix luteola TaxID=1391654 RepID=A0A0K1PR94_9BACT|nr:DUF2252 domain-containing protein [Labilithrix luteola]AKU96042.1 hypothetical protein AKJ09_02706 [Labilithrix luteola]